MIKPVPVKPPRRRTRPKARGSFHHGDLREAVLALAERDVEEAGHSALSINDIARRLGVTGPAVYRHFADRRALLQEVGQRGYIRFERCMSSVVEAETDLWRMLVAVGCGYVDFAVANPGWFRLQFLSHPDDRPALDLQRTPPRYREILLHALQQALQDRALAADAYRALWGLVHGLATSVVAETFGRAPSAEVLIERVERPIVLFVAALKVLR